jgi:hypothetical protein
VAGRAVFAGAVAIGTQLTVLMVGGGVALCVALYAMAREDAVVPGVPVGARR